MVYLKNLVIPLLITFSFIVTGTLTSTQADVFSIPNPPNSADGVLRPKRGMTMNDVLNEFGTPSEKKSPIGNPPITRWIYSDFTINFENKWVIHSSVMRK